MSEGFPPFFLEKIRRYTQVSSAVAGIATRLAGEKYLNVSIDKKHHAKILLDVLGNLKGPLMKVGQFLATIPGALPLEYAEELLDLQSNAPAMGWAFVRRRMATELGVKWRDLFLEFEEIAKAAASLGQVHQASLPTGERVACKLQYPGMDSAIDADMAQLKLLLSVYKIGNKALDPSQIYEEIDIRLREELNYVKEAQNLKIYQKIFAHTSDIVLPHVYDHLTTSRLLTMSWVEGDSVLTHITSPQERRDHIAKQLFYAWYYPFYHCGVIHGDPHPGNYKLMAEDKIGLLDLGCVRYFPSQFVQGVIDLYQGLLHNNRDQMVAAYEAWGFAHLNQETIDIITQWAKLLYDPLLDDKVRPIQRDSQGKASWKIATKVHQQLNQTTGISPPREFVFMDRAAVGIGSVLMRLNAQQNWYRLFHELIENVTPSTITQNQISFEVVI